MKNRATLISVVFNIGLLHSTLGNDIASPEAENYLRQFGYYFDSPPKGAFGDTPSNQEKYLSLALRRFQRFAKLPVTGVLDDRTKSKMQEKRCGMTDIEPDGIQMDSTPYKWKQDMLRWTIDDYSRDLPMGDIRRAMWQAFSTWESVMPIKMQEVHSSSTNSDIRIKFARRTHGDPWPFDGEGHVLAHATYPTDGQIHFDDDESWVYNSDKINDYGYTNILNVAIHELGHTMGLRHSEDPEAIMAPFYKAKMTTLHKDDVKRIQALYGSKTGLSGIKPVATTTTQRTTTTTPPPTTKTTRLTTSWPKEQPGRNLECPERVDAIINAPNMETYLFSGEYLWEFISYRKLQRKRQISDIFRHGPNRVTAAVTNPRSKTAILIKGRRVWGYRWNERTKSFYLDRGFPKTLSERVPFEPKTAFLWKDGNIVLMNGGNFAIYDEYWNVPTSIRETYLHFDNMPYNIVAAVNNQQNQILEVYSVRERMVFDIKKHKMDDSASTPIKDFLICE